MRIPTILMLLCTLISVVGCSSMRGNVVPKSGPTMEQVYDSMGRTQAPDNSSSNSGEAELTEIRKTVNTVNKADGNKASTAVAAHTFRKLPNPDLTMYVYPHLAGNAEVPIPGYSTVFNAYDHDHYALPQETLRD